MTALAHLVRRVLGTESPTVLYECRDCGTAVEATESVCPECGSLELARYELEVDR